MAVGTWRRGVLQADAPAGASIGAFDRLRRGGYDAVPAVPKVPSVVEAPAGGTTLGGSATPASGAAWTEAASGGLAFGGLSSSARTWGEAASGGTAFGGSATTQPVVVLTASLHLSIGVPGFDPWSYALDDSSWTTAIAFSCAIAVASNGPADSFAFWRRGESVSNTTASDSGRFDRAYRGGLDAPVVVATTAAPGDSASGGATFGGDVQSRFDARPTSEGGVSSGGAAVVRGTILASPAGGLRGGGATDPSTRFARAASGGLDLGGSANPSVVHPFVVSTSGGVRLGGASTPASDQLATTSGGVRLGGAAAPSSGGYNVYSDAGSGGPIDYLTTTASVHGLTWTTPALSYPGLHSFGVRAYNSAGEEKNLDCAVAIQLDAAGNDVSRIPVAPYSLRATPRAGGSVRLEWHAPAPDPLKKPTEFLVYYGVGAVDYGTVRKTTPATGQAVQSADLTGLADGVVYLFGVRAANSFGVESNVLSVACKADATGPDAVQAFQLQAVSEDDP